MYLRGKQYWTWAIIAEGVRKQVPLDTKDASVAKDYDKMLVHLSGKRSWKALAAVFIAKTRTIGALFDIYAQGPQALQAFEARLDEADLTEYVAGWQRWVVQNGASEDTAKKYLYQLRALIPAGKSFPASQFTRKVMRPALLALPVSRSSAGRYRASWSSFGTYMVELEVLDHNPVSDIKGMSTFAARTLYMELPDVQRYVAAMPGAHQALAALREGCGAEIGAALRVRRRDVDIAASTVFLDGTKNEHRARTAVVEPWAMAIIADYIKHGGVARDNPRGKGHADRRDNGAFLPDARLFAACGNRNYAWRIHARIIKQMVADKHLDARFVSYRLHDCRHSLAVRWTKHGVSASDIARNLGHADAAMVTKVYGKYKASAMDLARLSDSLDDSAFGKKNTGRLKMA